MRILMTTDTVGGVWTYSIELIRALLPRRAEVVLATMGAALSREQRQQAADLDVHICDSEFKLEWMDNPWSDVRAAGDWLLEMEETFRPDVIHLNGYAHGQLPFSAPVLIVAHSCVLSWWEAVKGVPAPAEWNRYRQEVGRGLRSADRVVAPSRAMLRALDRHYGPLPAAQVIYNARDASRFQNAPTKENFILSAGRLWDEAKNVAALGAIAPGLAWPVCVAGEPRHPDGATSDHADVLHLGRLDERNLADWMLRATIYALPAKYEPFGLSVLEAALSGCALVLGDIESLREIWADAAVFVPPHEPAALAEAIEGLIRHENERRDLAARARARAARYAPSPMADAYLSAYQSLAQSSDQLLATREALA